MLKNIMPDPLFENGIRVISQKDHEHGDAIKELGVFAKQKKGHPTWRICQWDSGPCLWENRKGDESRELTDGYARSFRRNDDGSVTFRLDTSAFYQGKPHKNGMYWPHLLVEQSEFRTDITEGLRVDLDLRLTAYKHTPIEGDFIRAAQFLLFLYMKSRTGHDFVWFGLHFFDSRSAFSPAYVGYDGGKPDASHALIYSVGEKDIFGERSLWKDGAPNPDGEWRHISVDMMPHIKTVLEIGKKDGYFKYGKDPTDFCIAGLNVGWETIGTFDHTMEMRGLSINM